MNIRPNPEGSLINGIDENDDTITKAPSLRDLYDALMEKSNEFKFRPITNENAQAWMESCVKILKEYKERFSGSIVTDDEGNQELIDNLVLQFEPIDYDTNTIRAVIRSKNE
jgi:hypothetical protein